jgi:uncharacterized iron-regulated membrane protein
MAQETHCTFCFNLGKTMFRKTLFWFHLVTGILAGLVIALLCFTGAMLAFE